jgi:periplasmic copper chaperone A
MMRKITLALVGISSAAMACTGARAEDFPPKPREAIEVVKPKTVTKEVAKPDAVAKDPQVKSEIKAAGAKSISVVAPWSRATPGASKNGAVFLEIKSVADEADKLLSASGAVADNVEIHNHINDNGIMQMRRVDFIDIAEGGATKLVPGGYHIMLLGLKQPLKSGETFKLQLTFEKAGAIEVDVAVRANNAGAGKGSGSGSGSGTN